MTAFAAFLRQLLTTGEAVFKERPEALDSQRREALHLLGQAYAIYRLEIAGPLLDFNSRVALAAAEVVYHACWFLVNHDDPPELVARCLVMPAPGSAADHLSADLMLRYLPTIHRRARAMAPSDPLPELLAGILRHWPLSGVLSEVTEAPLTSLELGGHPGLWQLYAERLARNEKAGWLPEGAAREHVELIFRELGKERSPLLQALQAE